MNLEKKISSRMRIKASYALDCLVKYLVEWDPLDNNIYLYESERELSNGQYCIRFSDKIFKIKIERINPSRIERVFNYLFNKNKIFYKLGVSFVPYAYPCFSDVFNTKLDYYGIKNFVIEDYKHKKVLCENVYLSHFNIVFDNPVDEALFIFLFFE